MQTKQCRRCKEIKPVNEFFVWKIAKDGYDYHCKPCKRKINLESYARHREKRIKKAREWYLANHKSQIEYHREYNNKNKESARIKNRLRKLSYYNLTLEKYNFILENQKGVCAICKNSPTKNRLAIDHDHKCCPSKKSCGKCVRGLLCFKCNSLLGYSSESEIVLQNAILYLKKYEPNH